MVGIAPLSFWVAIFGTGEEHGRSLDNIMPQRSSQSGDRFTKMVDGLLTYMSTANSSLTRHSGVFALTNNFASISRQALDAYDIAGQPHLLPEYLTRIDAGLITCELDGVIRDDFNRPLVLQMYSGRELSYAEKTAALRRGYELNPLRRIIKVDAADVEPSGLVHSRCDLYQYNKNANHGWRFIENRASRQSRAIGIYQFACNPDMVNFCAYMQWGSENIWHVKLNYKGCPSVCFFSDPEHIRDLFTLRDIPEGETRRKALRNWVKSHWRELRSNPELETKVREHLRGQTQFNWNNMMVEIVVPERDRKRETRAIKNREMDRFLRRDRRPKDPMKQLKQRLR